MERVSFQYDVRSAAGSGPTGSIAVGGGAVAVPAGLDGGATPVSGRVLLRTGCPGAGRGGSPGLRGGCWGWQPVLLAQPFLRELLHGLAFLVRRRGYCRAASFRQAGKQSGLPVALARQISPREVPLVGPGEEAELQESAEELALLA